MRCRSNIVSQCNTMQFSTTRAQSQCSTTMATRWHQDNSTLVPTWCRYNAVVRGNPMPTNSLQYCARLRYTAKTMPIHYQPNMIRRRTGNGLETLWRNTRTAMYSYWTGAVSALYFIEHRCCIETIAEQNRAHTLLVLLVRYLFGTEGRASMC